MKTIIAGSRDGATPAMVEEAIEKAGWAITQVISGCARGVDSLGEAWAQRNSIPVERFPAQWDKFRSAAGPIRNRLMAKNAEALIAVWDGNSPGTKHMIATAREYHLYVYVHVF